MNKRNFLIITTTVILTFIYAFARYIWLGTTSIQQLPLFLLNKVVSFSGLIIIAATIIISKQKKINQAYNRETKKQNTLLGLSGLALIVLHFLISIIIFSKEYFPNIYSNNKLSITGELSLLFANIALIMLLVAGVISFFKVFSKTEFEIKNSYLQLVKIALIFTSFHLLFMGVNSWFDVSKWNGGLPPMTLLAFILIVVTLLFRFLYGTNKK